MYKDKFKDSQAELSLIAISIMIMCFGSFFPSINSTSTGTNLASVGVIILMYALSIYHST